ncbi:hypothetical protein ACWGIA_11060 [Streptomyces bobili]
MASAAHAEINERRGEVVGAVTMEDDLPTDLLRQLIVAEQWHQVWRRMAKNVDDEILLVGTVFEKINNAPDGLLAMVARGMRTELAQNLQAVPTNPRPRSGVDQEVAYQCQAAQARYLAETSFLDDVPTVESLRDDAG